MYISTLQRLLAKALTILDVKLLNETPCQTHSLPKNNAL